jgi:hypothetical protein
MALIAACSSKPESESNVPDFVFGSLGSVCCAKANWTKQHKYTSKTWVMHFIYLRYGFEEHLQM